MAERILPTPDYLHKLLRYEPETGKLFWRERTPDLFRPGKQSLEWQCRRFNATFAGREAFTAESGGYHVSNVCGQMLKAHRVAWALAFGEWPRDPIDHANGNPSDNRLANLRLATKRQNAANTSSRKGASLFLGVSWDATRRKWAASIKIQGRSIGLGRYDSEEAAAKAYDAAAIAEYGDFARPNFKTIPLAQSFGLLPGGA